MGDGVTELVPSHRALDGILQLPADGSRLEEGVTERGELADGRVAGARAVEDLGLAFAARDRQGTAQRGTERVERGLGSRPSSRMVAVRIARRRGGVICRSP